MIATGTVFGKLTVVCFDSRDDKGKAIYECKCKCGNTTYTRGDNLINPNGAKQCRSCAATIKANHRSDIVWSSKMPILESKTATTIITSWTNCPICKQPRNGKSHPKCSREMQRRHQAGLAI